MNVVAHNVRKKTFAVAALASAVGAMAGGRAVDAQVRPIVLAWGAPAPDVTSMPDTTSGGMAAARSSGGKTDTPAAQPSAPAASAPAFEGAFYTPLPDEKVLHVLVGHSLFIDTKHRLSRVYVTNPDVLNSYTATPNQVVLTAKAPGSSSFIVWDEVGDTQVYMVAAEANVDGLSGGLKKAFPNENIEASSADGRITLTGTVGTQTTADAVAKFAAAYGKDVANQIAVSSSRIKQVRLKVRFAEVDRSRITQLGFNLFGVLNASGNPTLVQSTTGAFPSSPQINTGTGTTGSTSVNGRSITVANPLNFFLYDFQHQIGATIQDLENKQIMHILAEPNITAMSGEKANFLAGGEFPFPVVQGGAAGTAATVTIIFKPFGVKLDFMPLVNADGTIDLTVAPEVSALDYTNAVSVSGFTIPALSTRRASTHVALRDGQSFAISGLLDQRTTDALGRTPGIASVPVLGALFRSKSINHSNSELIVIVTPEIVDPLADRPGDNVVPASPVPLLNPQKFDESLPNSAKSSNGKK